MKITRKSPWSKKINTMEINVTQDQINSWEDGELIQNAMPDLEPAEREFIVFHEKRNNFIKNLVHSLKDQNNLILFDLVEKHGKILEPMLHKEGRELHFIYGATKGEERERIRHLVENDPDKKHNILASYGVFSTGVNIKRLDNVILLLRVNLRLKYYNQLVEVCVKLRTRRKRSSMISRTTSA
mgnify:CR=1 FL=1